MKKITNNYMIVAWNMGEKRKIHHNAVKSCVKKIC